MDEVAEGVENQQEIDALISRTVFNSADEEDLEAELEALTSVNLPAVPKTEIDLPSVPVSENESEKATSVEQQPVLAWFLQNLTLIIDKLSSIFCTLNYSYCLQFQKFIKIYFSLRLLRYSNRY